MWSGYLDRLGDTKQLVLLKLNPYDLLGLFKNKSILTLNDEWWRKYIIESCKLDDQGWSLYKGYPYRCLILYLQAKKGSFTKLKHQDSFFQIYFCPIKDIKESQVFTVRDRIPYRLYWFNWDDKYNYFVYIFIHEHNYYVRPFVVYRLDKEYEPFILLKNSTLLHQLKFDLAKPDTFPLPSRELLGF